MCHAGKDCQTETYIDRLNIVNSIFYLSQNDLQFLPEEWVQQASEYAAENKVVCLGNAHNMGFGAKACQSIPNIDILVRNLNTFRHKSDGLLFTPISERVRRGRHQTMYKWKKKHTIDIILKITRENFKSCHWEFEFFLLFNHAIVSCENLVKFHDSLISFQIVHGKFMKYMLAHLEKKNILSHEVLVEALLNQSSENELPQDKKKNTAVWNLEPIALRKDKSIPNALQTIKRT